MDLACLFVSVLFIHVKVGQAQSECKLPFLRSVDSCTDQTGFEDRLALFEKRGGIEDEAGVGVRAGTICVHIVCGVFRHAECSTDGRWLDLEGHEVSASGEEENCKDYVYVPVKEKTRVKRFWRRRRSPPPPPPPPPECGHPGHLPTSTVHVTSTSQGGVATYTCNSGYAHTAGDLTRTCQSNRLWSGTEPTCSYMNSCSSSPCQNGGTCTNIPESYTCACPAIWKGSRCEQVAYVCARKPCRNHVQCIDGSNMYTCVCKPGWYGQTCEIPVDCGQPSSSSNCDLSVTATTLGNVARYICHVGYNMTSGHDVIECGTDGVWSESPPTCIFAESCKSSPCENSATCTNLLGDYSCACAQGWTGRNCQTDIQPPLVSGCPSNIRLNATEKLHTVTWTDPVFTDPMNTALDIAKNYQNPEYSFPWGDFTVSYSATKLRNGLRTECIFNISIRPTPCEQLQPPAKGAVLCNDWNTDYGQICMLACRTNFSLAPNVRYSTWWICGDDGHWSSPVPLPACSVEVTDIQEMLTYHADYTGYVYTSCSNKRHLQDLYISKMMTHEVSEFCSLYSKGCDAENVSVRCDE